MGFISSPRKTIPFLAFFLLSFAACSLGTRKLASLYQPPPLALSYHKGHLLHGKIPVSILWYGHFSAAQKSILVDFLLSLNRTTKSPAATPSVSHWWNIVQIYLKKAGKQGAQIELSTQVTDESCSLGKFLRKPQISELARRVNSKPGGLTLVLTSDDVVVEGFCMSNCGFHGYNSERDSAFISAGNSVTQCPGQCAWPFHQPIYGPQSLPLGAPNGDVGVDGMVVNIASLLAGTVTNPFGNGYSIGSAGAGTEVASACTGVFGKGAYPGYAGELLLDRSSGGSYNAYGVNGRTYLLPALFDPATFACATLV